MRFVIVELGALVGVGDVFEQQRVQRELFPERFEQLEFVDASDVDPGDRFVGGRLEIVGLGRGPFVAAGSGIVEHRHGDGVGLLFADVYQRARRQAGFLGALLYELHRDLLVRRFPQEVKPRYRPLLISRRPW